MPASTANCFAFSAWSSYRDRYQKQFYIITEADRAGTTCLLAEDY